MYVQYFQFPMERDPDAFRSPRQKPSRAVASPHWELSETVKAMERCLARLEHQIVNVVNLRPVSGVNMVERDMNLTTCPVVVKVLKSSVNGTSRSKIADRLLGMRATLH